MDYYRIYYKQMNKSVEISRLIEDEYFSCLFKFKNPWYSLSTSDVEGGQKFHGIT